MAGDASRMPARENEYRNLILNQRVEASAPFITPAIWAACGGEPLDITGRSVFAGLDLSETSDLTALILAHCAADTGIWHIRPFFWLPGERLAEKAARDHAPYDLWAEQGFLQTTPGASVSYEYVAERLKEIFEDYHVTKVAFDRWNYSHLKPWLGRAGFSEHLLEQTFIDFGQAPNRCRLRCARRKAWSWRGRSGTAIILRSICALPMRRRKAGTRRTAGCRRNARREGSMVWLLW